MSSAATVRGDDGPAAGGELSKSEVFDLLRNQRRRFVLHYLKASDADEVRIGELAEQVAAWEYDCEVAEVDSTQRKRVYTTLQQSHLPKMDSAGIVDFDSDRGVVEATEELADLTIYLEIVPGHEFAWHEYYLGLGAVCSALMVALWAGVWPLSFVPPIIWGTVISLALVASAAVQVYTQRRMGIGRGEAPQELAFDE